MFYHFIVYFKELPKNFIKYKLKSPYSLPSLRDLLIGSCPWETYLADRLFLKDLLFRKYILKIFCPWKIFWNFSVSLKLFWIPLVSKRPFDIPVSGNRFEGRLLLEGPIWRYFMSNRYFKGLLPLKTFFQCLWLWWHPLKDLLFRNYLSKGFFR